METAPSLLLVRRALQNFTAALPAIPIPAPRLHLAKRRWRAAAADGSDFGFDLPYPLRDGDVVYESETARYVLQQQPEPVLEIALPPGGSAAARLGWLVGNLHFALQVTPAAIRVVDDPAVRQLCEREHLAFSELEAVFHPLSGGHSH